MTKCKCADEERNPVPPECAYRCARKTLRETVAGDVFYPEGKPEDVWLRGSGTDYQFLAFGNEVWAREEEVSGGKSDPAVTVIHNIYSRQQGEPA